MSQAGMKGLVETVCDWNKLEGPTLISLAGCKEGHLCWAQKLHRPDQNLG